MRTFTSAPGYAKMMGMPTFPWTGPLEHLRLRSVAHAVLPVALGLSLSACGASDKKNSDPGPERPAGVLEGLKIIETPEGGMAIYSDVIKDIQPGADITYCTYTNTITDKELFVHTTRGAQTTFGHHVIMFYTMTPEPPRTEECFGQDMAKFRQLLGGGAANGEGSGIWDPPANVGTVIPVGSQFVIQSHWINTGLEVVDGQAMTVTVPGADGPDRIAAGTVAIVDTVFKVPGLAHSTDASDCVFDTDHHLMMHLGHEHQWGTHVRAEVTRTSGQVETLFDRPFAAHDVFNPPVDDFGVDGALLLAKGDKIRMTCEWENTTETELGFPREMCVYVGYSLEPYDAHCINGTWDTAPGGLPL
jgi:hypothetical protein